jgi:hypothetical protein
MQQPEPLYVSAKNTFIHCDAHPENRVLRHARSKSWTNEQPSWLDFSDDDDMESVKEEILAKESGPYYKIEDQKYTRQASAFYKGERTVLQRSQSISLVLPDCITADNKATGRKVSVTKLDDESICSTKWEGQSVLSKSSSKLSRSSTFSFGFDTKSALSASSSQSQTLSRRNSIANLADIYGMSSPEMSSPKSETKSEIVSIVEEEEPKLVESETESNDQEPEYIKRRPKENLSHKSNNKYTTVMIKNIPCRYTQPDLMAELLAFGFEFNFLYLPHASRSPKTLGYGFINFCNPDDAAIFMEAMDGYQWANQPNSVKKALPVFANIQGLKKNVAFYCNKRNGKPRFRPWVAGEEDMDAYCC